jgi:hypothetical protein
MTLFEQLFTPERRAENERKQAALREKYGHKLEQNPAQANYVYGLAREQMVLDQLEAIREGTLEADDERQQQLYTQLAEGLALQGRFEEAAAITFSAPHKEEYRRKAQALSAAGVPACTCPREVTEASPTDAKGTTRPAQVQFEEVWDGERMVAFVRCLLCGGVGAEVS